MGANLQRANLQGANLNYVNLDETNLDRANLVNASLYHAYLYKASLINANLRGSNFVRAYLSEAKLSHLDLTNVAIQGAQLNGADLSGVNLAGANLIGNDFNQANLTEAILSKADFSESDLSEAILIRADLSEAKLNGVHLYDANLEEANLRKANLWGANLRNANLRKAEINEADLTGALLIGATLIGSNLQRSILNISNLSEAKLDNAYLARAELFGATLIQASLKNCKLMYIIALKSNFEGADLTGACITDWHINSETNFTNVICDYIYYRCQWISSTESYQFSERRPHDITKTFAPGEFGVTIVRQAIETVDLIFRDGIEWKAFFTSFVELQDEAKGSISIQAIENKNDGNFLIRLNVPAGFDKAEIETLAYQKYERELALIEQYYRCELNAKDREIVIYKQQNIQLFSIIEWQTTKPLVNNNFQGNTTMNNNSGVMMSSSFNSTQTQGETTMSNDSKNFSISGDSNRVAQGDNSFSVLGDNTQAVQGDNNQLSQGDIESGKEPITKDDALALITELEKLIQDSELPEETKKEVFTYLQTTRTAADKPEPKKDLARMNLEEMTKVIQNANGTVVASKTLWTTAKPIILKIASWLGAVAGSFFAGL
nr:pentapeptide repeat-containing protein [Laspinema sp. D3c]